MNIYDTLLDAISEFIHENWIKLIRRKSTGVIKYNTGNAGSDHFHQQQRLDTVGFYHNRNYH